MTEDSHHGYKIHIIIIIWRVNLAIFQQVYMNFTSTMQLSNMFLEILNMVYLSRIHPPLIHTFSTWARISLGKRSTLESNIVINPSWPTMVSMYVLSLRMQVFRKVVVTITELQLKLAKIIFAKGKIGFPGFSPLLAQLARIFGKVCGKDCISCTSPWNVLFRSC